MHQGSSFGSKLSATSFTHPKLLSRFGQVLSGVIADFASVALVKRELRLT